MFKLISWDGTRKRIAEHDQAVKWIHEHLSSWMEGDDYMRHWEHADGGLVYGVIASDGEHTDAFVWIRHALEGEVSGGCCKCQRALDLSTARVDDRVKRFGVVLDYLWYAKCVNDECDATTKIMESLDHTRWPHRAYKPCEVDGCIRTGIYRICTECMSKLDGKVRGNVAIGRPGAVEQAVAMLPKRRFISTED